MMMLFGGLFLLFWCISVNTHYTLYHSNIHQDSSYPTFDCLYAYLVDHGKENGKSYIRNSHLIPYCQRPDQEQDELINPSNENIAKTISFKELKKQNITSEELLGWFAPIDIAEKYEMNINDSDIFYNCSSPWFGSYCQYKFNYDLSLSFADIINLTFSNPNGTTGTCYRFLNNCNRGLWPLCIDWREICNGKIDCLNGEDEEQCNELEMNKCNSNEYRCHYGGQCIPLSFEKDSRVSIDCLDGSDEIENKNHVTLLMNEHCTSISTFQCQERISRYHRLFSCGDGEYLTISNMPLLENFCTNKRDKELSRSMFTSLNHISNMKCQQSFYCALHFNRTLSQQLYFGGGKVELSILINDIWENDCKPLSEDCSSEWVTIPAYPFMFGFFQFIYFTNRSLDEFKINILPDYVCFYAQRCPALLNDIIPIEIIHGLTCSLVSNLLKVNKMKNFITLIEYFYPLGERCLKSGSDQSCPNSSYFHCNESLKCILYHRVGDGNKDCLYGEDELFDICKLNDSNKFMCISQPNKCLTNVAIGNGLYECAMGEDEILTYTQSLIKLMPFSILCNYEHDYYTFLHISNDTDESNCNFWPCDNPYTHCNGKWNCPNGIDELNCPNTQCSLNEYECQDVQSNLYYCLSKSHLYEKYFFNCTRLSSFSRNLYFYNGTDNITNDYYSWNNDKCDSFDKLCRDHHYLLTLKEEEKICLYQTQPSILMRKSNVKLIENEKNLCKLDFHRKPTVYDSTIPSSISFFKTTQLGYFPFISTNRSIVTISKQDQNKQINTTFISYCHRGIPVLTNRNQTIKCFCPPNYFGDQCQWQNQRISLTLQLLWRGITSNIIIFQLIIMIIDEQGQISPLYEQITYMPNRDCNTKFNIYLLYPDRPKSLSKKYSIRIDLYEKIKLKYWSSWFISIPFQFLPVNRISTQLIIPEIESNEECTLSCGQNGKCYRYYNNKSLFFCQCNQGYSGSQCQIKQQCNCASDSFCFNSSICICPLHKFGRFCHLTHSICQSSNNPCQHDGLCVPTDDRIGLKQFTCICRNDYSGERCKNKNNQIDIYLSEMIISNVSLLLLHFITAFQNAEHQRITLLKKIPFDNKNVTVDVAQPFNILLVQTIPDQYYYLAILRETFLPSEYIYTEIQSKQRCSSLKELNNTLLQYDYFGRIKYYPLLCRQNIQLMCFYDDDLMCICDINRFSNCFLFNQTINNYCQSYNHCENAGECFQNNETCPTKLTCICPNCYYGSKCQFSTKGFIASLDLILGYHIKPYISINEQPLIIKLSIIITTIMFIIGLISGILSIITFHRKIPRQVGSGNYLLISSISSIIMIILLIIKFWQLILFQISLITNQFLFHFNCIILDFSLRILLSSNEWLNACVAFERMISASKGTHFQKVKSRRISKWIIISIFILTIITHLHDPIHRQLIEDFDIDEKRIWCFVRYSSSLEIYNSFIIIFHFIIPFLINIISALWIIKKVTRNRAIVRPEQSFHQHLQYQIHQHRQLLFAPCILILLSLPRLIISFLSGCMRSAREPWLYLIGYFLSYIPSMLTLFVFILPSKNYRNELNLAIKKMIRKCRLKWN